MDIEQTLETISQLQTTEKQLYMSLTKNAENVALGRPHTFSENQVSDIKTQINSLSASRVTLYNTLADLFSKIHMSEKSAKEALNQQADTLGLLEKELNRFKANLSKVKDEKYNNLRMIEINTYFSKQYDAYRQLMKLLAIYVGCLLVAVGLKWTPIKIVSKPLIVLISLVALYFIGRQGINMAMRSNMNYDEFMWPGSTTLADSNSSDSAFDASSDMTIPYMCASSECCNDGTVWSDASGCIPSTNLA